MAKKTEEKIEDVVIEEKKAVEPYGPDDKVEIGPLFYDKDKYSAPVSVIVNGKHYMIQRGVKVTVPRIVAEILEQSAYQEQQAGAYIRANEGIKNLGEI